MFNNDYDKNQYHDHAFRLGHVNIHDADHDHDNHDNYNDKHGDDHDHDHEIYEDDNENKQC